MAKYFRPQYFGEKGVADKFSNYDPERSCASCRNLERDQDERWGCRAGHFEQTYLSKESLRCNPKTCEIAAQCLDFQKKRG